uniref:Centrosomal protein kizuna n=1 Tax=Anser brachyrhynchus TaxID=132585 RepID=A0A8B9I6L8_9AVES
VQETAVQSSRNSRYVMLSACFLKLSSTCVFQNPWVLRQAGIHSGTATSRGLYHPATIFMGRHMSAAWSMQQKAPQAAESRSVPEPCSHRQAVLSSDQTDRCLLRVGSDMPCTNKRDKQDGKADVLLQEKMPITSRVALVESSMHSSLSHLTEHRNLAECHLLSPNRASVESRTADLNSDTSVEGEEVTCEHLVASAEDYKQAVPVAFVPEPSISEEDQESIPGMMEPFSSIFENEIWKCRSRTSISVNEAGLTITCSALFHAFLRDAMQVLQLECSHTGMKDRDNRAVVIFIFLILQAPPLLREVLPEEVCGDRSSIQSNESSYSLPSIPNDGREMKQAKHAPRLDGTGKQEVTSWCEDESQEESVIKKIPITGRSNGCILTSNTVFNFII